MSLFRIPRGVCEILEKKMRDFLWEGFGRDKSSHLVSWEVVTKPKEFGGLGIGNLLLSSENGGGDSLRRRSLYGGK